MLCIDTCSIPWIFFFISSEPDGLDRPMCGGKSASFVGLRDAFVKVGAAGAAIR